VRAAATSSLDDERAPWWRAERGAAGVVRGCLLSPLLIMALSGCHRPVKVMPMEKIWTELPLMYIMNAIIPTFLADDCAISHTFCTRAVCRTP
jgi:hypothetical protein